MKGVILAAGKGTRLYPVTKAIPKPILPLANRPTMAYAFDQLRECGITDICIVVGETGPAIMEALRDGSEYGVNLSYVVQTEPKGLAHAVGFAQEFVDGDDFMLYLGDAIYGSPLAPFVEQFQAAGAANLNLVKEVEDPRRFGVANVRDGRIVRLVEKPLNPESNLAMAGMYIFGPQIWDVLPKLEPSGRGEYEITDAIQMLVEQDDLVIPGIYEGTWFDTGTLSSFLETSRFLAGDGTVLAAGASFEGDASGSVVIGEDAHVRCQRIENSVILPGARIDAAGVISGCLLGGAVSGGDFMDEIRYGDLEP